MHFSSLAVAALALCTHVVAEDVVCGSNEYTREEVQAAADAACEHFERDTTAGRSNYPHTYRNFEGFEFDGIEGPYQEFPMLSTGRVYTGGRPGPDRVIITEDCELAGQITHTGARGNAFLDCEKQITARNTTAPSQGALTTPKTGYLLAGVSAALMLGFLA
ncbi:hypothetical protein ACRALDRAFT_1061341 [Sodiomyces alcalophilus JCM 7366]|uniref:uncharacterized protein n=1 Tax=Sodiomyces alcalophilus JCM 7366 TaxID=591952 RepID=UPI0039B4F545